MESTDKTTPTVALIPQPNGGFLKAGGTPGNRGGTGRPPDEFKRVCQRLTSRAATLNEVRAILKDRDHPAFLGALKWATEHGYGKPKEDINLKAELSVVIRNEAARE